MSRINPLYVILLLVMLLGFFWFKISGAKAQLNTAQEEYKETLSMANELSALKNIYGNSAKSKAELQRILSSADIKLERKDKKSSTAISAASLDYTSLNFLMGKILNNSFNITALEIKRINEDSAKLYMEIAW